MKLFSPHRLAVILILFTLASRVQASPRDELLRLVPESMTLCVVVQDVRERFQEIRDDSFLKRLSQVPFIKVQFDSPEFLKLIQTKQKVLTDLGITTEQLKNDLLGDAIVFAYRHVPEGSPRTEEGLFLVWARDQKLLVRVVDRINEQQKKSGELKDLIERKHRDRPYFERVMHKDGAAAKEYFFVSDHTIAFSPRENVIQQAIERTFAPATEVPAWSKRLEQLGLGKVLGALLVNPRAFDEELGKQEAAELASGKPFLKQFRNYWKAVDSLGLYVEMTSDLEIGLALQVQTNLIPEAGKRFFAELGTASLLWKSIPDDALFALAPRIDFPALVEMLQGFCDEAQRKEIARGLEAGLRPFLPEKTTLDSLKKGLAPNWGLWVNAPAKDDRAWAPKATFAIQLQSTSDGTAVETTCKNALQFLVTMLQFASKEPVRVETIKDGAIEIKSLVHPKFPTGVQPSFAVKDGYLVLASTPETIRQFTLSKDAPALPETPLLRISAKGWQSYLTNHRSAMTSFLESMGGGDEKTLAHQIDAVLENLKSFDQLELAAKTTKERATLIFRLKTRNP